MTFLFSPPQASQGMMSCRQYDLSQYWKENMPKAVESGRVKLRGSLISTSVIIPVSAQLMFGLPRPGLLHTTACTARGRLRLPRFQSTARLV